MVAEPQDPTTAPSVKRKPGRPPKSPLSPESLESNDPTPESASPERSKKPSDLNDPVDGPLYLKTLKTKTETGNFNWLRQVVNLAVGDTVWFWMVGHRDGSPYPAMVTQISGSRGSVNLRVHCDGHRSAMECKVGVRHIDDPDHNDNSKKENGAWEMSPQLKLLHTLAMNNG